MLINGHRDRTFYQFPCSSMTFHVLPCVFPVSSTTFQSVPRPSSHFYDLFQQDSLRRMTASGDEQIVLRPSPDDKNCEGREINRRYRLAKVSAQDERLGLTALDDGRIIS